MVTPLVYLYNTYSDASNYERGFVRWLASEFQIGNEAAGTGVGRATRLMDATGQVWDRVANAIPSVHLNAVGGGSIRFALSGTDVWDIVASGHLLAGTDNVYDIGASGATRPRNVYIAGAVTTGVKAGAAIDADVISPTDGMIRLDSTNNRIYVRVNGLWKYAALT